MKLLIVMVIHLFQQSSCLLCNKTIGESPSGAGLDCVFPFTFYGHTFTSCTNFNYNQTEILPGSDDAIIIWCATKVDKFGNYNPFGGNDLGFCDPRCEFIDEKKNYTLSKWDGLDDFLAAFPNYEPCYENCGIEISTWASTTSTTTTQSTTPARPTSLGTYLPLKQYEECGYSLAAGYIVGGSLALAGEFPYAVVLGYGDNKNEFSDETLTIRNGGNSDDENSLELRSGTNVRRINNRDSAIYKCSGSLINRRYVLTAAHCHSKENPIKYVVVGDHDLDKDPDCDNGCPKAQVFRPDGNIIIHEAFNDDTLENDIALIRLDGVVDTIYENYDNIVMPVCLPLPENQEVYQAKDFLVHGWGRTEQFEDILETRSLGINERLPRKVGKSLQDPNKCRSNFPNPISEDKQLCVGGEAGFDSCQGDSGGPLIDEVDVNVPATLYGIVSYGSPRCGAEGIPAVYTRVEHYIDWIRANLRD